MWQKGLCVQVESFGFWAGWEEELNVVLVIVLPMYSGERNHLDLWVVISQMSTIGVGQWQMHLSTSSSAQGYLLPNRDQMLFTPNWHEKWHLSHNIKILIQWNPNLDFSAQKFKVLSQHFKKREWDISRLFLNTVEQWLNVMVNNSYHDFVIAVSVTNCQRIQKGTKKSIKCKGKASNSKRWLEKEQAINQHCLNSSKETSRHMNDHSSELATFRLWTIMRSAFYCNLRASERSLSTFTFF